MTTCLLRLAPQPFMNRRFLTALALMLLIAAGLAAAIADQLLGSLAVWSLFGLSCAAGLGACVVLNRRRQQASELVLVERQLTLPAPALFGRRSVAVSLEDLSSLELHDGSRPKLVLGLPRRFPIGIQKQDLINGQLEEAYDLLSKTAATCNQELSKAARLFEARKQPPFASFSIAVVLVLVLAVIQSSDDHPVHRLISYGGMNDWLVTQGEWYRLGAAALLHADWLHLAINCAFLMLVGLRLEYVVGGGAIAAACSLGMIFGSAGAYLAGGDTVVVGASGGVFALFGLYAVTVWRQRRHLPTATLFAPPRYLLAALLVLFVPLPGFASSVHVAGFVVGIAYGLIIAGRRTGILVLGPALAGSVVLAASLGYSISARFNWLEREPALIAAMAEDSQAGIGTLDLVGWYALRTDDTSLQRRALSHLGSRDDHSASSLGTLADLLLAHDRPEAATSWAHAAFKRRADYESRERLLRAEVGAFRGSCTPRDYTKGSATPPTPQREFDSVRFTSSKPLYVHALVGSRYVLLRTGLAVAADPGEPVVVLGFDDSLPWRRKPWILNLPTHPTLAACSGD